MKPLKLAAYIFFSTSLALSIAEFALTSILLSKTGIEEKSKTFEKIKKDIGSVANSVSGKKEPDKPYYNPFRLLVAYLMIIGSLSIILLVLTFWITYTKLKGKKVVELSVIEILIILKIVVYILLLVYRYIASKGLEITSAIVRFINTATLLGLFILKIIYN